MERILRKCLKRIAFFCFLPKMVERTLSNRIQNKTTIFIAIAIAALGAAGVTTAMITSAPTAEAVECRFQAHIRLCPPPVEDCGSFCNMVCSVAGCHHIGPDR
jgi:hypothetical protein